MRAIPAQRMSTPFLLTLRHLKSTVIAAMFIIGLSVAGYADMASVNLGVWKAKFGVTDTQANDPLWLAKDDDGDGITNGAELAAGTNPFSVGSVVKIKTIVVGASTVALTFSTENGKQYIVQGTPALGTAFTNTADISIGTGADASRTGIPKGSNKFFRVLVQDVDSDLDGMSDWAEKIAGFNPNAAMTDGRTPDGVALSASVASLNQVTVTATKSNATQPADALTAPVEVGSVTVSRGLAKLGSLLAPDITVNLQKVGTAVQGTDYDAIPDTVIFHNIAADKVVSQQVFTINPKFNSLRRTNATAIVKAVAGTGYTLGSAASGSVVINAAGIANGTGLTANYFNTANSVYSPTQTGIFGGAAQMSRTDATVDFSSGVNGWGVQAGPTGLSPISTNGAFSVRWTGQILPQYSEKYFIDFRSDDSAKVWVNGVLLIDRWTPQGATDYVNSIDLTGGVLYDIQIDYWNSATGSAEAKLYWWSASQPKQIIPQGRLFPAPTLAQKLTAVTNTITAVGYEQTPFTLNISTPNIGGTITYALDANSGPLPPGLTMPPPTTSGIISGTPTAAGTYNVAINALNSAAGTVTGSSIITFTIFPIGSVTRETLVGSTITSDATIPTLDDETNYVSATSRRLRGYIVPPKTGNYYFWLAANSNAELWISNDSEYVNRVKRAAVTTSTGKKVWNTSASIASIATGGPCLVTTSAAHGLTSGDTVNISGVVSGTFSSTINGDYVASVTDATHFSLPITCTAPPTAATGTVARTQRSPWLTLVAGRKYYFDVLHNVPGGADDYVALGWCQDDIGTVPSVIGDANPAALPPAIPNGGAALQGYPRSGTVPSYIFQPYDYPPVAPSTGTLYAANLGPQGSSLTKASGSANLQLNQAQTQAILHFNYQNLSSPRTGYHLHSDAIPRTFPAPSTSAGEIIFDIDDIDSFHPELKTADGGYIWNLTPGGTFLSVQDIRDAITQGKVYLNVHSVNFGTGEIRGNLNLVDGSQVPPDANVYSEPTATDVASESTGAAAARFLNQASFGASPTDVAYVKSNGFSAWITDQLTKPASRSSNDVVAGLTADINTPYPSTLFTDAWWKYSITGQDQLRQRLAFALSEILVVSWNNNTGPLQQNGRILADYYDNLVDFCLPTPGLTDSGNFRGALKSVTLTPAMGLYLDMRGNQKEDLTLGRHPNENYGREIMQLFSVGLNRMWDDGRFVLDSNAGLVPTYSQPSILGMASLLTGWNYAQPNQANGRLPTNFGPGADYLNAMVLVPAQHDNVNPKLLLNNVVIPAATGLTPRAVLTNINLASPCVLTTSTAHGLKVGDSVRISNVTGGTFTLPPSVPTTINAMCVVTEIVNATQFKVGINCTGAATAYTNAAVTGTTVSSSVNGSVIFFGTGGVSAITGSQADNAGTTLPHPYDQYGMTELERAIDNICNNDNVPPYVCRQLIQRLVTSAPSPGYVYRVVQKWKNNGSGVRGDLAAVVKQILLDGEARSYGLPQGAFTAAQRNAFGKQREPMLRLTGAARAFPSVAYTGTYQQLPADTINANKFRITTTALNDFSSGFPVSLDFRSNYVTAMPSVPNPVGNPTSTTYSINATLPIAQTHLDVTSISATGTPTTITTAQVHGLPGPTNQVWFFGLSGVFNGATPNSGAITATQTGANTFTIPINTTKIFQVTNVAVGANCVVTTAAAHGLAIGSTTTGVTVNGVTGGVFSGSVTSLSNATTLSVVGIDATHFSVTGVTCSSPPTSYTTWRECSNPCLVITQVPHGLITGDSVTMANVSGGSFTPTINGTFAVTVFTPSSFTIASSCASPSTPNTGNIVGGNTMDVTATGMVNVTYTQPAGSNVMTVNTGGPQTDVIVPGPATLIKSKVYLDILSGTAKSTASIASVAIGNPCTVTTIANHGLTTGDVVTITGVTGGTFSPTINSTYTVTVVSGTTFTVVSNCTVIPAAATGSLSGVYGAVPADGVYPVDTANGSTSFTVLTADTPIAGRTGSVIVPKISTSYSAGTNATVITYNTNVNHNMAAGTNFWVDVPVVGTPVTDAEYTISTVTDEDHFTTSYLPANLNGGTYPKPSGSNNSITIFPLVPAPMGRGVSPANLVNINQSTFNLGSTEGSLTQSPLNAPTVFNYFFPNYKFPGTLANSGIDSPEFQLTTDTNISNLTNSLTNMIIGTGGGNGNVNGLSSFNNGGGNVVLDIGSYLLPAKTINSGIDALIDELANILVGAPLDGNTKTTISKFVRSKPISAISLGNPCTITSTAHGMVTGSTVTISGVTGGTFSPAINSTYTVTVPLIGVVPNQVPDPDHFTVPVNCTVVPTSVVAALADHFPMTTPTPTNLQMRDRVRAIIHLIITSAEYAVQK